MSPQATMRTLPEEHQLLLRQVTVRADRLLRVTSEDRWPTRELASLLDYLRAEVMRQAADEERLLFGRHDTTPGIARLSRDHARLRIGVEALARAAAGESIRAPAELAVVVRDILGQLDRHLVAEETEMAAWKLPGGVPATVDLTHRRRVQVNRRPPL